MKEMDLIESIERDWEEVRKKLCSRKIKYNDIESLKKENFFRWFDNMITTSDEQAVTKLSNVNLLLRSCKGKGHQKSRFKSLKKGDKDWEKYKDCLKVNRYNEPKRGFMYFGISTNKCKKNYNDVKETCLREIRAFDNLDMEYVSTLKFKISDKYKCEKVFDFSKISEYENCDEIITEFEEVISTIYEGIGKIFIEIFKNKNIPLILAGDSNYIEMIMAKSGLSSILNYITNIYLVKVALKLINDSTFKKINKSKLIDAQIDTEYSPFHAFANYIEYRGYAGIIYNSTVHKGGLNLVLFDRDGVETEGEICEEKWIQQVKINNYR